LLFSGAFLHHLAFHAGRIATYGLLGAIVAGIFSSFEVHRFSMQYRAGFAIASGTVLICLGLVIFGALPMPRFITSLLTPQASVFGKKLAGLVNSEGPGSKMGLGLLAGLLPCGLTWAMLVAAANTLSPARGLAVMASFGLGTVPALLAAGMSASLASARTRLLGERAAAIFIVIMGASMALRGLAVILGFGDHCGPMDLLYKSGLLH
jgi:sulfite exporter TauE/SafE